MQTPSRYRGYDGFGDIWSDIMKPIKSVGGALEKIYRPVVQAVGHPLENELHQVEVHVIDPYLKPLIRPIQKIMPKITIAGHRYDLGGSQLLQKAATGAVAGYATGGPYGAVVGALAGMLQHGKPNVLEDLEAGAAAGYVATVATAYLEAPEALAAAGGGGGAAAGGAGGAGGLTASQIAAGVGTASGVVGEAEKIGQQTGLIKTPTPGLTPQQVAALQAQQAQQASMFGGNMLPIAIIGASVIGLIVLLTSDQGK